MDAIMLALVAVLLANTDGRSGLALSRLVSARRDRRVTVGVAFGAFIVNAVVAAIAGGIANRMIRSEEHTSELQSLMRISYAVFCLKKKKTSHNRLQPKNKKNQLRNK